MTHQRLLSLRFGGLTGVLAASTCFLLLACGGENTTSGQETESTAGTTDATTQDPTTTTDDPSGTSTTDTTSTPTTAAPTTGDPTTSSTDTCGFVCPPDMPISNQCDPGSQDCPDGEKCTPYVMTPGACCVDAVHCVQVTGEKLYGEPCTRESTTDDCAKGFFCMTETSGSTGEGVCEPLCVAGDDSSCEEFGNSAFCISFNDGFLPLCEIKCDPLLQDCSGDGFGCYAVLSDDKFICAQSGFADNFGNDGDECYTIQSCKPGLVCIASGSLDGCGAERCCSPVCDLTEMDPCEGMEQCLPPWAENEAPPQYANVGICLVPG